MKVVGSGAVGGVRCSVGGVALVGGGCSVRVRLDVRVVCIEGVV